MGQGRIEEYPDTGQRQSAVFVVLRASLSTCLDLWILTLFKPTYMGVALVSQCAHCLHAAIVVVVEQVYVDRLLTAVHFVAGTALLAFELV